MDERVRAAGEDGGTHGIKAKTGEFWNYSSVLYYQVICSIDNITFDRRFLALQKSRAQWAAKPSEESKVIRVESAVDPTVGATVSTGVPASVRGDWQTDWDGQREDLDVGGGGGVAHWVEVVGLNRSGTVTC